MQNPHDEARQMVALLDSLDEGQQARLQAHLAECGACRDYADQVSGVVRALRLQPLAADAALVRATQMRVRLRAVELRQQQERMWLVFLSCLFVGLSTALTTPLLWQAFVWMGVWTGISNPVWETAFAFFWIVPALVVSVLLVARGNDWNHDTEKQSR